jgi:hypothetical protein
LKRDWAHHSDGPICPRLCLCSGHLEEAEQVAVEKEALGGQGVDGLPEGFKAAAELTLMLQTDSIE